MRLSTTPAANTSISLLIAINTHTNRLPPGRRVYIAVYTLAALGTAACSVLTRILAADRSAVGDTAALW